MNNGISAVDLEDMHLIYGRREKPLEIACYQEGLKNMKYACIGKLDALHQKYKNEYGADIIEMYADIYTEFREWLDEQIKEQTKGC